MLVCPRGNLLEDLDFSPADAVSCHALKVLKHKSVAKIAPTLFPWAAAYNTARLNVDRSFQLFPLAIVRVRDATEVQAVIRWANKHAVSVSIRSGGHQPAFFSIQNQLVLDLQDINYVRVESDRCLVVGGAARLGDVYKALGPRNLLAPFGTCASVTVSQALIGGIGFLVRTPGVGGLALDHLEEALVVLASGELITANAFNEHAELIWALRGAGVGNFGVVVQMTFRIAPLRTPICVFELEFALSGSSSEAEACAVIERYQSWMALADLRLNAELDLASRFGEPPRSIVVMGQFLGSRSDLLLALAPMLRGATVKSAKEVPLLEAYGLVNTRFDVGSLVQNPFTADKNFWAVRVPPRTVRALVRGVFDGQSVPGQHNLALAATGGAFGQVAEDATAFSPRNALQWVHVANRFSLQREQPAVEAYVSSVYAEVRRSLDLRPSDELPTYVGFPNLERPRDAAIASYYSQRHVEPLRYIKTKYDPSNFFHYAQSIPTQTP